MKLLRKRKNSGVRTEDLTEEVLIGRPGRFALVMFLSLALFFLALFLNINLGSIPIPVGEICQMLWDGLRFSFGNLLTKGRYAEELHAVVHQSTASQILFSIRIPRLLLAAVLGGALAVSGYLLQVFFRNPIAGPFVLGISSGSKMMVGITLIFLSPHLKTISSLTLVSAAFAGALITTSVALIFARKVHNMSLLLVVGIMVGYICSAITDFSIAFAQDHEIVNLTNWAMGSFSASNWHQLRMALLLCLPGVLAAALLSKPISAYALGENYARSMGIRIKPFRIALILISSLLSACVTALAGPISFVGIAVPHLTRSFLKSSKPSYVIPASFLCGSVFCMFCDLIARTAFSPTELAISTVTSFFGAPVVITMMLRRKAEVS